jgi:hypothetical protein
MHAMDAFFETFYVNRCNFSPPQLLCFISNLLPYLSIELYYYAISILSASAKLESKKQAFVMS